MNDRFVTMTMNFPICVWGGNVWSRQRIYNRFIFHIKDVTKQVIMLNNFMKYPAGNTLAVIVLIALVITWFTSLILSLRDVPVRTDKGWYGRILPIFAFLGIPATLDLLQTRGITFVFAGIAFVVFATEYSHSHFASEGQVATSPGQ